MGTTLFPLVGTVLFSISGHLRRAQRGPKRIRSSSGDLERAPCEPRRAQESQGDPRKAQESLGWRQETTEGRTKIQVSSGELHPNPGDPIGAIWEGPREPRKAYKSTSRVLGGPRSAQGVEQKWTMCDRRWLRSVSKVRFTQPGSQTCIPSAL